MDAAQAACDTVEKLEKKFFDDHGEKHTHPPLPPCPLHGPQEKRGVLERRNWLRIKGNDIAVDTAAFATDKPWFPTPRRRVHQSVVALLGKTILTVFFLFLFPFLPFSLPGVEEAKNKAKLVDESIKAAVTLLDPLIGTSPRHAHLL